MGRRRPRGFKKCLSITGAWPVPAGLGGGGASAEMAPEDGSQDRTPVLTPSCRFPACRAGSLISQRRQATAGGGRAEGPCPLTRKVLCSVQPNFMRQALRERDVGTLPGFSHDSDPDGSHALTGSPSLSTLPGRLGLPVKAWPPAGSLAWEKLTWRAGEAGLT